MMFLHWEKVCQTRFIPPTKVTPLSKLIDSLFKNRARIREQKGINALNIKQEIRIRVCMCQRVILNTEGQYGVREETQVVRNMI